MSETINIIMIWLARLFCGTLIATVVYLIIFWRAKSDPEKAMQEKQADLDQQHQKISKKEEWYKQYVADSNAMLFKKRDEAVIKEKQVKETLVNAEKIREESQQKVDQLTRENSKLRNELNAAR